MQGKAMSGSQDDVLVRVRNLKKYFVSSGDKLFRKTVVKAVDDVSLDIRQGEILGLVGESGCGKSTLGFTIINLLQPTGGQVLFDGMDVAHLRGPQIKQFRRRIQLVFQDPSASLNPRRTIFSTLREPFLIHHVATDQERKERIEFLIQRVGLSPYHLSRYPHELSGGQKQRVSVARALALNPDLIICDEAVSALDVSIQAQVINLLEELKDEFKLTYLFISHNLSVIHHICDRVAVMYLGQLVELGRRDHIFDNPSHPYTRALISAIPQTDPGKYSQRILLVGDIPSPANPPSGCRFHTRCSHCMDICKHMAPSLTEVSEDHQVACHLFGTATPPSL